MKRIKSFSTAAFILITIFSCNSNKKLNQNNAEKTIKEFISTHSINNIPGTLDECNFNVQSIAQFSPVSQFSETEATTNVTLKCSETRNLGLTFVFKKNIDNHWILMNIAGGGYNNGITESLIIPNQNINMIAQ